MTGELFILALALGAGSWLLAAIEMIAVQFFSPFFFRIGIPVYRRTIDIETKKLKVEQNATIKKSEGKFRFSTGNMVYFRSQTFFFRLKTPFSFKAIGMLKPDNKIDIVARVPLGTTLFLLFWVICWTVGASIGSSGFGVLGFGLIGWAFAGIIVLISYPIEKGRMDAMVAELKEIITPQNNG